MNSRQRFMGVPSSGSLRDNRAGAALIITLACIVILTALILAFFSHTLIENQVSLASADQTSASLFARGAVDSVIGEVKQEITAGSVLTYPPSGSDLRDPNCIFLPANNQAMMPSRMDPNAPVNVLKRSAYNIPFYAGSYFNTSTWPAPMWAVNSSTTNPGSSSRAISLSRWNEALLMPTANPQGSGSPSTNIAPASSFTAPDWIYINRAGAPATVWSSSLTAGAEVAAANTNCVAGRYAYVVYDESGLIDINAAGYRPSVVTAAMMRHKISEACADLSQIGLNSSDVETLVSWRNPVNGSSAATYTNYVYGPNTNAFLTPATGERMFTSRQQLINFLIQNVAVNQTDVERLQAALPLMTHFSRELNSPSWYPQVNGASGYGYLSLATNSANYSGLTLTNAFAPLARTSGAYTDLTNSLVPQPNQPAAFARFPLSRLAWLGTNGPANGATAAQILQSFGLSWDSANFAWKYVGPSGTTVLSTISTLSQVATAGREPNFFELLKAGILSGSTGIHPNIQSFLTPALPSFGAIDSRYGSTNAASGSLAYPDEQIIQIGIGAIDQASTAPLPARVEFGSNTGALSLYGTKSIPYIYRFVFAPYRPTTEQTDDGVNYPHFHAWWEPVLWDPYQTPTTNTAPLQIRIRADGPNPGVQPGEFGTQTAANNTTNAVVFALCTPQVDCGPAGANTGLLGANGSSFEIDAANASNMIVTASSPVLLSAFVTNSAYGYYINDLRAGPPGWGASPDQWTPPAANTTNADVYTENGMTYAGFWLGRTYAPTAPDTNAPFQTFSTTTRLKYTDSFPYSGTQSQSFNHNFILEANYGTTASPNFQEVQRMVFPRNTAAYVSEQDCYTAIRRRLNLATFNDPRTGRFGFELMQPADYYRNATTNTLVTPIQQAAVTATTFTPTDYFGNNTTYAAIASPSVTFSPADDSYKSYRLADNTSTAGTDTAPSYQDGDGVQRQGDAWWSSASANTESMRLDTPQDRPVMLNRAFQSVGELGYVYRDMPWRSLDFSTAKSADAGLLDFFSITDGYAGSTSTPVVGGRFNLNTPHPEVLQAMLSGASRAELYPANDINSSDAVSIAQAITNLTWNSSSPQPLLNKSELATRLAPADPTVTTGNVDSNIKERREALVRALGSAGQVRTWNLMIDVIAQTGRFPATATGFDNFLVTGEQRYWAHVAIDRYSGQIISLQLEPVSE